MERLGALGLHVHAATPSSIKGTCAMQPFSKELSDASQKRLAGNSMSLHTQTSFMMYVLENVKRRPREGMPQNPRSFQAVTAGSDSE